MAETVSTTSTARFSNPLLTIIRVFWILFVGVVIVTSVVGLSEKVQIRQTICDGGDCPALSISSEYASVIEESGLSLQFLSLWEVAFFALCVLVFIVSGAFFMLRGSDELLPIVIAYAFVAVGSTWPLTEWDPTGLLWFSAWQLIRIVGVTGMMFFLAIFPSRRFVPAWLKWYVPFASVFNVILLLLPRHASFELLGFLLFMAPLGGQIYRYRNISTPEERQQAKWLLMAWVATVVISVFHLFVVSVLGALGLVLDMLLVIPLGTVALFLIPIAVLIAIQKYKLWNINFIINRSLVYGAVTAVLGVVFVGGFFGLRTLIRTMFDVDQDLIAATIPAAVGVALFRPTRERLKHFVDRRFYGIEMDYDQSGKTTEVLSEVSSGFANYHDLKLVGIGGMGVVYRAEDAELGHEVALKVLPAHLEAQQEYGERFAREAQTIANLDHPNIVKLYRVGAKDGSPYMVMEYINGPDLNQMLKENGQIPLANLLPIMQGVASALDYAHSQGIVHRDIKPSNIMIDEDGRPVLMDFGIARIANALTQLTGTGGMVGTLDYIAPEQIRGASDVDRQADVYALGVMAYQMLTGELPFKKQNPGALVLAHLMEPPPDACTHNEELPHTVCAALQRAMAKKPEGRFGSAGEMLESLAHT